VGAANALGVLVLNIAPFVMTLCSMTILQGICYVFTKGAPTGSASPWLHSLGTGYLFGFVPYATAIWIALSVLLSAALKFTSYGRKVYAVGGNLRAARLCGISTFRIRFSAYALSGMLATVAGLIMSGYINTTSLTIGGDFVMNSLAAVLIGGNAIEGGRGGVWGVVLGSFFIIALFALLTMLSIGEVGKLIAQGLIIFGVVAAQGALRKA
jgi:ribose/xylose/arabinose/galactoside ABC-type transport system permease subunit